MPTWATVALVVIVGVVVFYGVFIGKRCPKCKSRMVEVSSSDPLSWKGFRIKGIPRMRSVSYRCSACPFEESTREFTDGGP